MTVRVSETDLSLLPAAASPITSVAALILAAHTKDCFTAGVRRDLRRQIERRHPHLVAIAPSREEQVLGGLRALADCSRWLERADDADRERERRRHLASAAAEALAYFVAALAVDGVGADSPLQTVEREVARFSAHAERGETNPLSGESPAADVSLSLQAAAAALMALHRHEDAHAHLVNAAAAASLVAELR